MLTASINAYAQVAKIYKDCVIGTPKIIWLLSRQDQDMAQRVLDPFPLLRMGSGYETNSNMVSAKNLKLADNGTVRTMMCIMDNSESSRGQSCEWW